MNQPANHSIGFSRSAWRWIAIGAVVAAVGVGLGAFGAHGLQTMLKDLKVSDPAVFAKRIGNWETAAHYQMLHAVGMILVGLAMLFSEKQKGQVSRWFSVAGTSMLIGVLIFSGMLYLLVLTDTPLLGAIVFIGGVAMIVGWVAFAIAAFQTS